MRASSSTPCCRLSTRPCATSAGTASGLCGGGLRRYSEADTEDEQWNSVIWPAGGPPRAGERFVQPAMAGTYRRLMEGGRELFYRGELAHHLAHRVEEMGGWLTPADFADHRSE